MLLNVDLKNLKREMTGNPFLFNKQANVNSTLLLDTHWVHFDTSSRSTGPWQNNASLTIPSLTM